MTIADKLNYLNDTKQAIKQAITDKGVDVSETDTFRSYANKIASIEAGGGSGADYKSSLMATTTQSAYSPSIVSLSDYVLPDYTIEKGQTGLLYPKRTTQAVETENFTKVGNVVIEDKVASGFSTSNYIRLPAIFNPNVSDWEMFFKINSGSLTASKGIFSVDTYYSLVLGISTKLCVWTSSNGQSWSESAKDNNGITTLKENTDYYLKATYIDNVLNVYLSEDGDVWTTEFTQNISLAPVTSNYSKLGLYRGSGSPLSTGLIDLSESYIKLNNEMYWQPYTKHVGYIAEAGKEDNFFVNGEPFISSDYAVTNFSDSNYLQKDFETTPTALKCISRIKFNTVISRNVFILCWGGYLGTYNGMWQIWTGANAYGGSVSSNTTYWTCVTVVNGVYNLYVMVDDGTYKSVDDLPDLTDSVWTHSISNASGSSASSLGRRLVIGRDEYYSDRYFDGVVYLKDTVMTNPETGALIWSYRRGYVDGICTKDFIPQVGTNTLNAYHIEYTDGTSECLLGQTEPTGEDIKSVQLLESGLTFEEDKAWTYNEDREQFE